MSTKTHVPICKQAEMVLDLDMAILGCEDWEDYWNKYVVLVTREYCAQMKPSVYHAGREIFLEELSNRPKLFYTTWGARLEAKARNNIKIELCDFYKTAARQGRLVTYNGY